MSMRRLATAMTELLWMPAVDGATATPESNPNYLRRFRARVLKANAGNEAWLLLDRTAFYAEGGGQPSDVGRLTWDGGEARVVHVSKKGAVKHVIEGGLPPGGTTVQGDVDWDIRYAHMRHHTSQHLLSAIVWARYRAPTVGNQIGADGARVDFARKFTPDDLRDLEADVNAVVARNVPVRIYEEDRAVVERRTGDRALLHLVPQSVRRLRIVEIVDPERGDAVDVCPCAGTHVMRTGELGRMEIVGRESKGEGKERLAYVLAR